MAVCVEFPDGARRDVPSQLRPINADDQGVEAQFEQVPLNCDPCWRYERAGARWVALRRHVPVSALQPAVTEWWRSIGPMADLGPVELEGPRAKDGGADPLRSAA